MSVYPPGASVCRSADISEDGVYRYRLLRQWSIRPRSLPFRVLPFVMLNPSTADADIDDPTIRRCVGFALREGYDGIGVWNLYALRATKPGNLPADHGTAVGPENDRRLQNLFWWAKDAQQPIVAGWGANAKPRRVAEVLAMPGATNVLHCLGVTASGSPRHPLYVGAQQPMVPWGGAK